MIDSHTSSILLTSDAVTFRTGHGDTQFQTTIPDTGGEERDVLVPLHDVDHRLDSFTSEEVQCTSLILTSSLTLFSSQGVELLEGQLCLGGVQAIASGINDYGTCDFSFQLLKWGHLQYSIY